jgi:hypothetical protein
MVHVSRSKVHLGSQHQSDLCRDMQIRMVAGFTEVAEREVILVLAA